MKFRDGFVSNSSSTSFLVVKDKKLDITDATVVQNVISNFEYENETSVEAVQERLRSEVERPKEYCIENLANNLTWGSEELVINIKNKKSSPEMLELFRLIQDMEKEQVFKNAFELYSKIKMPREFKDKLRNVVIGTLTAKLVVDFEKKYRKDVLIMTFASDEGDSASALLKYSGLPDIEGCDWVVLAQG